MHIKGVHADTMIVGLLVSVLVAGHKPGYSRLLTSEYTFGDTQLSQVEFRFGGKHTFKWSCKANEREYWEIVVPSSYAWARMKIVVNADVADDLTTSSETSVGGTATTTIDVDGGFKLYQEGFSSIPVTTVARFGSKVCDEDVDRVLTVHSTEPFAFSIGEGEEFGKLNMQYAGYYYIKSGAWAGWMCPFSTVLVAGLVVLAAYCWTGVPILGVHTFLAVVWFILLFDVFLRAGHTSRKWVVYPKGADNADGPFTHSDGNGVSMAVGLMAGRVALISVGIFVLWLHSSSTENKWRTWIISISVILAGGGVVLGIGGGLFPFVMLIYYLYDAFANNSNKSKNKAKQFPDLYSFKPITYSFSRF